MAVRRRGKRWAVEVYDSRRASRKRYVGTFDSHREAKEADAREAAALSRRRLSGAPETVASFASRWLDLRPRQKESTNMSYREQVRPFASVHGDLLLVDVDAPLAYNWLRDKRWTHTGIRAMFSDARRYGLVESNPFAGLRLRGSVGRKDLEVLSAGM